MSNIYFSFPNYFYYTKTTHFAGRHIAWDAYLHFGLISKNMSIAIRLKQTQIQTIIEQKTNDNQRLQIILFLFLKFRPKLRGVLQVQFCV